MVFSGIPVVEYRRNKTLQDAWSCLRHVGQKTWLDIHKILHERHLRIAFGWNNHQRQITLRVFRAFVVANAIGHVEVVKSCSKIILCHELIHDRLQHYFIASTIDITRNIISLQHKYTTRHKYATSHQNLYQDIVQYRVLLQWLSPSIISS